LINFYDILGVHRNAGEIEIKNAFRKLAKQYHPDKNPQGQEHFEMILQAYETLSQPNLKRVYDYKLEHNHSVADKNSGSNTKKTWKFDEREMRRRKYYDEHIRKYAKSTAEYNQQTETKRPYNEYKYILFATPLAVALFLLIMKLAAPANPAEYTGHASEEPIAQTKTSSLNPGDAPYNSVFGHPLYDTAADHMITVKNRTGADAIFCAFTRNRFVRCFFIPNNYSAEVSQLPAKPLYLRYSTGNNYDPSKRLDQSGIYGAFTNEISFFKSRGALPLKKQLELDFVPGINAGFELSDETEFFKRPLE
jgi:curved DNA-binding protein CbpA